MIAPPPPIALVGQAPTAAGSTSNSSATIAPRIPSSEENGHMMKEKMVDDDEPNNNLVDNQSLVVVPAGGVTFVRKPMTLNPPQASLFVSNIDWSLKKQQVKRSLTALFSRHGRVLDVILLRGYGLAGQAFVLLDSVETATRALHAEQGFLFFDRPLQINYTAEKSDRIAKRDGTYKPIDRSEKRMKRQQQYELLQRMKQLEKDEEESVGEEGVPTTTTTTTSNSPHPLLHSSSLENSAQQQQQQQLLLSSAGGIPQQLSQHPSQTSNILFADKLPLNCNELMLSMLFRQHPGFQEVRIPRPGMAFIEYQLPTQAESAMKALQGYKLTETDTLVLQFSLPQPTMTQPLL
jgi:U2 small nuclear ribonucleoprotein B''